MPVTEAVFENGVLKPLLAQGFKEHQHYQLSWQEAGTATRNAGSVDEAAVPAHLAHRVDVLPDGRRVIRFSGARVASLEDWPEDYDPITVALKEIREEQNRLWEEEWDEFYPVEPQP